MNKAPPLISIIIAVYNGASTLQKCIESIARQTYPHYELIVIDGASTDETVDILAANDSHISYWISEPDTGIYNAWNKGLDKAKGDWIYFLGADDYFWNDTVLHNLADFLIGLSVDVKVVYGQVMLISHSGEEIHPVGMPWGKIKSQFQYVMCIPHQGVMHRRDLFDEHGQFDESYRITGDYELLLRELKLKDAVFIPNLIVTGMRQSGISSQTENSLLMLKEARRAHLKHGNILPGKVWILAMCRVYIRYFLWLVLGEKKTRRLLDIGRTLMGLPPYWTKK